MADSPPEPTELELARMDLMCGLEARDLYRWALVEIALGRADRLLAHKVLGEITEEEINQPDDSVFRMEQPGHGYWEAGDHG